jgi:di/tricarboxylate transporter
LKKFLGLALLLCGFALIASANPSAGAARLGDSLILELKDQHDQTVAINEQTNLILFAAGKSTSALMSKTLEDLPPTTLKDKKALYVADISGMPSFITKIVAIPKMQKRPYTIALLKDDALSKRFPQKDGAITVIKLKAGKVTDISFVTKQEEITKALQ